MEHIIVEKNSDEFPWDASPTKIRATLIDKRKNATEHTLVPMGNTIFRRVTFSVITKSK
ncbi:MAG: hypothetical protein R6U85_10395 [Salinivirgaceae bacterium]